MKFIAYDRELKKWLDPLNVIVCGNGDVFSFKHFSNATLKTVQLEREPHVTIYPYIGRTDKDGDKIYDGSIIEAYGFRYAIEYDRDECRYVGRYVKGQIAKKHIDAFNSTKMFVFVSLLCTKAKLTGHIAEDNKLF